MEPPVTFSPAGPDDQHGQTMVLAGHATLARLNISANTAPVVRLTGWRSNLRGSGAVSTTNAAPRGVVNMYVQQLPFVFFRSLKEAAAQRAA